MGAGTLGPVFRAYDSDRDRLVVAKLFKLDLSSEQSNRLVSELNRLIAARLKHPVLVKPLSAGMAGESPYLVTEYVAAESLDALVREYGQAPPADALRAAAQLADVLDFGVQANMHHGALCPRDVLMSSDETRLSGLGIAEALAQVGIAVPAKRPYASPEQMAGGKWDARADVFGLAALIFELLWARRVNGTGNAACHNLATVAGADMGALRLVFARALADDPGARFATTLEFAAELQHAFPGLKLVTDRSQLKESPPAPPDKFRGDQVSDDLRADIGRADLELRLKNAHVAPLAVTEDGQPDLALGSQPGEQLPFEPWHLE
ncbi:MAG TPA: protein kinase, partial [Vicinamibacterales bacterium]|nr:protein kinase [Vicinamibacterales bacterium]